MTREEKIKNRKERRNRRYEKRLQERRDLKHRIMMDPGLPIRAVRQIAKRGYSDSWEDPDSPTGRSQVCSYYGTCQSPCNGDC